MLVGTAAFNRAAVLVRPFTLLRCERNKISVEVK